MCCIFLMWAFPLPSNLDHGQLTESSSPPPKPRGGTRSWTRCQPVIGWPPPPALTAGHHPTLRVYNRDVVQSRAVAVYATSAREMRYSGADIPTHTPLPPLLERIRGLVEERLGERFGTVMLNRYADGDVYIGRHSDTRENRIIASLSLGAERTFVLTPRLPPGGGLSAERRKALERRSGTRFPMAHRSMVVMQGRAGKRVADGRKDAGLLEGASKVGRG